MISSHFHLFSRFGSSSSFSTTFKKMACVDRLFRSILKGYNLHPKLQHVPWKGTSSVEYNLPTIDVQGTWWKLSGKMMINGDVLAVLPPSTRKMMFKNPPQQVKYTNPGLYMFGKFLIISKWSEKEKNVQVNLYGWKKDGALLGNILMRLHKSQVFLLCTWTLMKPCRTDVHLSSNNFVESN